MLQRAVSRPCHAGSMNCGADHGRMTSLHTRPARSTLTLNQAGERLQLVLVEVGDGAKRHP